MTDEINNPTLQEIWETLSAVDCSEHTEAKGNLTYLSWAWCWGILMENFPYAQYEFGENETHADGSMTVHCTVTIGDCRRNMWLPVMDYKNKAIGNPDARDISDNKMRCLTKCIAMFGLGHYIYAGEDLPASPSEENGGETPQKGNGKARGKAETPPAAPREPEIDVPELSESLQDLVESKDIEAYNGTDSDVTLPFLPRTEDGATVWLDNVITILRDEDTDDIESVWENNKKGIEMLSEYGHLFERLQEEFSKKSKQIEEESENAE